MDNGLKHGVDIKIDVETGIINTEKNFAFG